MRVIPIAEEDIAAERALLAQFERFWQTEQGDPRTVYDRFIAATPVAPGVDVQSATAPAPGIWVHPADAANDRALLFVHGGGYGRGSAPAYAGLVSQLAARAKVSAFVLEYPLAPEAQLPAALDIAVAALSRLSATHRAVAIAGDSAGGGLTLATTARAVQEGLKVAA